MATPRRDRFVVPKTTGRDYRNAFMHLLEAAYWAGIVGALVYADVDLWVWAVAGLLAGPPYIIGTAIIRRRLGILRRV